MRLSPVLVAVVAWVTLSNPHPASGQTAEENSATGVEHPDELELAAHSLQVETAATINPAAHKPAQKSESLTSANAEKALVRDSDLELAAHSIESESGATVNLAAHKPAQEPESLVSVDTDKALVKEQPESRNPEIELSPIVILPFKADNPSWQEGLAHANPYPSALWQPELLAHTSGVIELLSGGAGVQRSVRASERGSISHTQHPITATLPFPHTPHPAPYPLFTAQTPPDTNTPPPETPAEQTPEPSDSTPAKPPGQEGPPPGTQTPEQETPNRIDVTPGGQPSGSPSIEQNIPVPPPSTPGLPTPPAEQPAPASESETRVLVAEVLVSGVEGRLQEIVYNAIRTRPGRTTTKSQLQEDINAVFATGYFAKVRAEPSDTPLGVRVTFIVEANPVLRSVRVEGKQVLPDSVVEQTFREQYNETLNLRDLQAGIRRLEQWYKDRGYVLAQVVDTRVSPEGTVTLEVAEGVVEDVQVRFLNKEGETTDAQGQPIRGRTRQYVIAREMAIKPGQVFNRNQVQRDLQRIYGLGLFDDVKLSLNPGEDPRKVNVQVNVRERNTGSIAAGAGFSSAAGLFGTASYQQQNLFGRNQKLGAEVQIGQRELLFDLRFTDPWIAGDPYRTSYTINLFRRRTISLIFDGGDPEIRLPEGDRPRILRLGGGITFSRPLSRNPLAESEWVASLGLQYQRVSILDSDGEISPRDELGNDLSFSGDGEDDLVTLQLGIVRDRRDNPLRATRGSVLRLGLEQSVPIGLGSILLTRVRGSYSYYIPVRFTNFTRGPQALAFNVQAGTVVGDLPPYEAFSLGGANSVRGYDEGDLGSGRSYFQATAEYRFPVFSIIGGALFVDFGTDLGTAGDVPGRPAEIRGKPGSGFGYGLGVRIQSPLGPIRIDYGFDDEGEGRIHFGIGERF